MDNSNNFKNDAKSQRTKKKQRQILTTAIYSISHIYSDG